MEAVEAPTDNGRTDGIHVDDTASAVDIHTTKRRRTLLPSAVRTLVGGCVKAPVQTQVSFVARFRKVPSVGNENISMLIIAVSCHVPKGSAQMLMSHTSSASTWIAKKRIQFGFFRLFLQSLAQL